MSQPQPQPTPRSELSVQQINGQIAVDIGGTRADRIMLSPVEARKLVAEIERATGTGFGRDMESIRKERCSHEPAS